MIWQIQCSRWSVGQLDSGKLNHCQKDWFGKLYYCLKGGSGNLIPANLIIVKRIDSSKLNVQKDLLGNLITADFVNCTIVQRKDLLFGNFIPENWIVIRIDLGNCTIVLRKDWQFDSDKLNCQKDWFGKYNCQKNLLGN